MKSVLISVNICNTSLIIFSTLFNRGTCLVSGCILSSHGFKSVGILTTMVGIFSTASFSSSNISANDFLVLTLVIKF